MYGRKTIHPLLTNKHQMIMDYNDFKQMNLNWDNGFCRLFEDTDTVMRRNYEIANNVQSRFYEWYDQDKIEPQRGDVVEFVNCNRLHQNALVESVDKHGLLYICENGSTHTDGTYFSTSGGAFTHKHKSHFEFCGYVERVFWTWGCWGAGGNQGIYFTIKVKKFKQINPPKIVPMHKIFFGSDHYKQRGSKVVIMDRQNFIFEEFPTIEAFKEWAEYVGFTYHKAGRDYWSNLFLENKLFWELNELPDGVKPIEGWSNGRKVKCYIHNDGETITMFRPNPNATSVYVKMNGEPAIS